MHTALLDRSLEGLRAVRQHVTFSAKLRAQSGGTLLSCKREGEKCFDASVLLGEAPDAKNWRVIDHCTVMIRTYALFEAFVSQILREYLSFLSRSYKLSDLGADFTAKYTRGIGQILIDQDKTRYENIDIAAVISDATAALSGAAAYQILPEAMLRAEQNLRMTELIRLFAHCGLTGMESWLSRHIAVETFFSTESRLSGTVDSELKQIVEYRNEAAHGDVDQVLGTEVLIEVTEFFEALLRSITDFVQYDTLRRSKEVGKAQVLGVITERFRDDVVVAKIANASLAVGESVYVNGKGLTMIGEIKSIQVDGVDKASVQVSAEREVGLRLGIRAKEGCELIRLT